MNLTSLQGKLRLLLKFTTLLPTGFFILLFLATTTINAQPLPAPSKNIGDPVPMLRLLTWIKGSPVNSFKKGNIYVLELWATWCGPCVAEMPHLSELARRYKDTVNFIGIDIREPKSMKLERIKAFVDSMGLQLDYAVAVDEKEYVYENLYNASGAGGIPKTFIIDREGRIAWIGHPCFIEPVLESIVNNNWDINKSLTQRKLEFRLKNLQDSLYDVLEFAPDGAYRTESWKRDSAFLLVDEVAKTVPQIKYTPRIVARLFSILLKNDLKKAYEFGKEALSNPTYESSASLIMGAIEILPREFNLTPEIYQLGIEATQAYIDNIMSCLPERFKLFKYYYRMAEWYWITGNKQKAIESQEKAVEDLRSANYRGDENPLNLATYEAWLEYYKKNTALKAF